MVGEDLTLVRLSGYQIDSHCSCDFVHGLVCSAFVDG